MGKVIKFPAKRNSSSLHNVLHKPSAQLDKEPLAPFIISEKEDEAFFELLKEWPCYLDIDESLSLRDIFDLYYSDELDLSQDCALEFMFHMYEPESVFDIGNALYTWNSEDREFFVLSISMHAEIIENIKKDEY